MADKRIFTLAMLEGFKEYVGKTFVCFKKWEGISIPFLWNWKSYTCDNCGFVKNDARNHVIEKIEVYKPENILDEKNVPEIWIAFAKDGKLLRIPDNKRDEFIKLANERNQG